MARLQDKDFDAATAEGRLQVALEQVEQALIRRDSSDRLVHELARAFVLLARYVVVTR